MANRHVRPRLVATLAIGMREILRNGMWVLGKVMPSGSATNGSTTQRGGDMAHRAVGSVKQVGSRLKGALTRAELRPSAAGESESRRATHGGRVMLGTWVRSGSATSSASRRKGALEQIRVWAGQAVRRLEASSASTGRDGGRRPDVPALFLTAPARLR